LFPEKGAKCISEPAIILPEYGYTHDKHHNSHERKQKHQIKFISEH